MLSCVQRLAFAEINEAPMEGRRGTVGVRLRKRGKKKLISPVLFSTELRHPEFAKRLAEPGPMEKAAEYFDAIRKPVQVIHECGLLSSECLHEVMGYKNSITMKDVAAVFYHADRRCQYELVQAIGDAIDGVSFPVGPWSP